MAVAAWGETDPIGTALELAGVACRIFWSGEELANRRVRFDLANPEKDTFAVLC
jgi:hypothetical protein